jgi:multiple sugar transport system permease protein
MDQPLFNNINNINLKRDGLKINKFSLKNQENILGWMLNIPSIIIVLSLMLFPLLYAFWTSLHQYVLYRKTRPFIWFGNYLYLLHDKEFIQSIIRTLVFAILDLSLVILIGFIVALVLNQDFKFRGIMRALILIPWAVPPAATGLIWKMIYDPEFGLFNGILYSLGLIKEYIPWLAIPRIAFVFLIVAVVWRQFPLVAMIFLAGLQSIPNDIYEAAQVDGATFFQRFYKITLPLLRGSFLVVLILQTMFSLRAFDEIYSLTYGGPANSTVTMSFYMYFSAFNNMYFGRGAAIAYIMALITLAFSLFYIKIFYRKEA